MSSKILKISYWTQFCSVFICENSPILMGIYVMPSSRAWLEQNQMQKIWFIHKKKKKQETKNKRYISHYIISTELEHSNDHWQRSSRERKKTWEIPTYIRALTKDEIPYNHWVTNRDRQDNKKVTSPPSRLFNTETVTAPSRSKYVVGDYLSIHFSVDFHSYYFISWDEKTQLKCINIISK